MGFGEVVLVSLSCALTSFPASSGWGGVGFFFSPWNQVDLILGKSGRPFYWALTIQNPGQKQN